MTIRALKFHHSAPPYMAGDIAGLPAVQAQALVDRGIATFHDFEEAGDQEEDGDDSFSALDRAGLIAFAKDKLGMADEPGADVTDEQLREALRAAAVKPSKKGRKAQ